LDAQISNGQLQAFTDFSRFCVRVSDEAIRRQAADFASASNNVGTSKDQSTADDQIRMMSVLVEALNERIGIILRGLDDIEDQFRQ
jgi:hypothetical protein